jgi:hypothetical protein
MTGTFQINSTTPAFTKPAKVSLGLIANPDGSLTAVLPTDGTPALNAAPVSIPGLPGLGEQPVGERGQRGHELGAHLGVVTDPQVPRPVGVGVATQIPSPVDTGPPGLRVGLGRGSHPAALVA